MPEKNSKSVFNQKDLIAYFLVAGTGAAIQLFSSSYLQGQFGISYNDSIIYSYLIGFVVGFVLTKLFAFDARKTSKTRREMIKFLVVAVISLGITYYFSTGSLYLLTDIFHIPIYQWQIPFTLKTINVNQMFCYGIGMGFSFISNYILHKTFTFKSTGFYDRLKILLR